MQQRSVAPQLGHLLDCTAWSREGTSTDQQTGHMRLVQPAPKVDQAVVKVGRDNGQQGKWGEGRSRQRVCRVNRGKVNRGKVWQTEDTSTNNGRALFKEREILLLPNPFSGQTCREDCSNLFHLLPRGRWPSKTVSDTMTRENRGQTSPPPITPASRAWEGAVVLLPLPPPP